MDFVETFLSHARETAGYDPRGQVVLAVSGGPDSMALLALHAGLSEAPPVVAHLDHHLRDDSAADASFVRDEARRAGAIFVKGDWTAHSDARGIGIESAARRARYKFFTEVAREHGRAVVATGHHRDDQAETVLHRLLRGTGPGGLAAILPRRILGSGIALVRPLLPFRRAEILEFLSSRDRPWREDPTNQDGGNLRATIRARLIPYLSREILEVSERLAALSARSAATAWPAPPGGTHVSAEVLERPLLLRGMVEELLEGRAGPLELRTMARIHAALTKRHGVVDVGRGYRLRVSGRRLVLLTPE